MVAQLDKKFIRARPSKIWSRLLAYLVFEGRPLTTRGRWINPLVFAGYRLWAHIPFRHRAEMPIFILGTGRSGTTVLGTILALHRQVGYLNEPKALWHAALGNDDLIGSYSTQPGQFKMNADSAPKDAARRLRRFYNAYLGISGCQRVVDKYPELLFRTDLIDAVFPQARKIVLLRNGADTCQSIETWSRNNGRTQGENRNDWWGFNRRKWEILVQELVAPDPIFAESLHEIRAFTRQVDMAAVEWVVTMNEALRLQRSDAANMLYVRYEDLVENPLDAMKSITGFCDLEPDDKLFDYAINTLATRAPYPAPKLHPAIRAQFNATMTSLGYNENQAK